jgi:hypothetical protein
MALLKTLSNMVGLSCSLRGPLFNNSANRCGTHQHAGKFSNRQEQRGLLVLYQTQVLVASDGLASLGGGREPESQVSQERIGQALR